MDLHNKTPQMCDQNIHHIDLLMVIFYMWLGTSVKKFSSTIIFPNDKVMTLFLYLMTASAVERNCLPKITGE